MKCKCYSISITKYNILLSKFSIIYFFYKPVCTLSNLHNLILQSHYRPTFVDVLYNSSFLHLLPYRFFCASQDCTHPLHIHRDFKLFIFPPTKDSIKLCGVTAECLIMSVVLLPHDSYIPYYSISVYSIKLYICCIFPISSTSFMCPTKPRR